MERAARRWLHSLPRQASEVYTWAMKLLSLSFLVLTAGTLVACGDDGVPRAVDAAEEIPEMCSGEIAWCLCAVDWSDETVMCFDPNCVRCDDMVGPRPQPADFVRVSGPYECGGEMTWSRADECVVEAGGHGSSWAPPHLR